MRISARCDYACRALVELSLRWPSKDPMRINDLAERQGIPLRYLVQILLQLKQLGWVKSSRGQKGGYNLAQAPERIILGEVIEAIGGPLLPIADTVGQEKSVFSGIWKEVEGSISLILGRVTFEDICKRVRGLDKVLIYQI